MFNSIVVAVDGSEAATKALGLACELAKRDGAALFVVHSPQIETILAAPGYAAVNVPISPELIANSGRDVLQAAISVVKEAGVDLSGDVIGRGHPADDIIETAKLQDADLIVMGRRGLGGVASLFLGSVSQKVSQMAHCSVLTVH